MREKDNPILPKSDYSKKILELLKIKQGDYTLYELSKATGMQQGTLRRKLENPNGWAEIHFINELLDFLGTDYETLFGKGKFENSNIQIVDGILIETKDNNLSAERLLDILNQITETKLKLEESLKEMLPVPYTRTVTTVIDPRLVDDIREKLDKKSPKFQK